MVRHALNMAHPASIPGLALVAAVLTLLAACGQPLKPRIGAEQAMGLHEPWTFRVLTVHDALQVKDPTPGATHLIDVEITAPPELAGRRCALPYDEWAMGAAPPKAGTVHTLAPRAWVAGDPRSRGRPMEGFNGTRPLDRR